MSMGDFGDLAHDVPPTPSVVNSSRVTVGIATSGRAPILRSLVQCIAKQTLLPSSIIICYSQTSDIEGIFQDSVPTVTLSFIKSGLGSTVQRNVILDHTAESDFILFLDDDFFIDQNYIQNMVNVFNTDPAVFGITGHLLADGAQGPGLTVEYAHQRLLDRTPTPTSQTEDIESTYGCNMAFRLKAIHDLCIRFDEKLPLYAWYEDIDFSRSLGVHGRIVKANTCIGVHLGSKKGKTSGLKLGYSQIANPIYLARKGTYPWSHAIKSVTRHTAINVVRSFKAEYWIDRKGRRDGNFRAWKDFMLGRLDPARIKTF